MDGIRAQTEFLFRKGNKRLSGGSKGDSQMGTMSEDLDAYRDEYYTKKDLRSGIKLVGRYAMEFGGMATAALLTLKLLSIASGVLAPIGLAISPAIVARLLMTSAQGYARANTEERKQMRAAMKWIKGGFSLGDRLIG